MRKEITLRLFLICPTIIALSLLWFSSANANAGPHGNYTATTDACAGCHRTHTAQAADLLINTVPALCYTCHGSAATGADTNVIDGVYEGTGGGNLLAGGFNFYNGNPASSTHSVDGTHQNAWGSGTTWPSTWDCAGCHNAVSGLVWPGAPTWGISAGAVPGYIGQNVTMPLTCTSCHDPHGGRNYRMLQQRMHPATMQQEDPPGYVLVTSNEIGGTNPNLPGYIANYTNPNYRLGLGDWCTGCHYTFHQTDSISAKNFNAEDGNGPVRRYRHAMNITLGTQTTSLPLEDPSGNGASVDDQVFCLTCHYAHGSAAFMTTLATAAPTNDSSLLRLDNRGVCEDCHKK